MKKTNSSIVIVSIYIDNILVTWNNLRKLSISKTFLDKQFKIKDLGLIHYFFGIELNKIDKWWFIKQSLSMNF